MNVDDNEIAEYVESLLDHGVDCEAQDCPSCHALQDIFQIVRTRLFASSHYPEVAISLTSETTRSPRNADAASGES